MNAPRPGNEAGRLRALLELKVLDTGPEPAFDDFTRIAALACQTPSAVITFIDDSRQWFKSHCGLPFTQTHRDLSFCAHAILSPDVLVVPDATRDPRFADNALVTGPPHIRFYAGAPLILDGFGLGTIAVIDWRARELTADQLDGLRALSRQVITHLEFRRSVAQTGQRVALAESSLQMVTEHHRAIVDSALDAIVTMDAQGRVTEFNPAAERLFGYRRAETIGRLMGDLIVPPEDRERHAHGLARFLRTGEAVILGRRVEVIAMRRDGTRFPVELSIQRFGSADPPIFTGFMRDVTDRMQATRTLQASEQRYRRQRGALSRLIQDERLYHGDLAAALRQVTETTAKTLDVARVSVWRIVDDPSAIRCADLFEVPANRHSSGQDLSANVVPAYFRALLDMEVIAVDDARDDPRTRELTDAYLTPLGITSMLDARIHVDGALDGVLCCEHVGAPRAWTLADQTFAVSVATLVSLALEGHQRRRAQQTLTIQSQILSAVSESLGAYVERGDWKEAFSGLLRCALTQTDSKYGLIGVVVDGPVLRVLAHEGIVWDKVLNREFYEQAMRDYETSGYVTFKNFNNLFARAITTGEVVIYNAPAADPRSTGRPDGHPPLKTFLGVPIRAGGEVTGVVALANRADGYGDEERRRIEALVRQAGGICESYRQREAALVQDEERRKVEIALRVSEERFQLVARATNDALWDWDLVTNTLFVTEGYRTLFGDDSEAWDATIESWSRRVHPDDHPRITASRQAAFASAAQVWSGEYRFRRAAGTYADIFDRGFVWRDERGHPVRMIGAMMDVTDRKQLEAQLRQSQKMEAIGQLAGGVAHDFNNLLTVIQGHASLLLIDGDQADSARDSIGQIADAAERAAGLTRQLLAFSRKQVLQSADLDLNVIVANMMRLLQRILGEHIALQVELSAAASYVRADASMMEQVIMNLAVNARDAMPEGGQLILRTAIEQIDEEYVRRIKYARPGLFVHLGVTDTGSGITAQDLPHIFEPFYTTKDVQKGTGLGLATVYGIVKQHQGWVNVQSAVGEGATFDVFLPAVDAPAALEIAHEHEVSATGGGETLLVVEDEESVARLARLLLERHGYTVLEAADGPAALAVWEQHRGRIDLVLTDMVMPGGMSGLQLANQLLQQHPRIRVIVSSGYSPELFETDPSRIDRMSYLQKPYSAHQLLTMVREGLDAR